jgi:ankyrin repeat protein
MIKLEEFESDRPYGPSLSRRCDVWDAICVAVNGDAGVVGRLLERDPKLSKYNQPLYFAVREGHLDAARALLDAGADSGEEYARGD